VIQDQVDPSQEKAAEEFWTWFQMNAERFRSLDSSPDKEQLLDEILEALHRYDEELYFQISEPLESGGNEFIISADGIVKNFARVNQLVAAAPPIHKWTIIALKPASSFDFVYRSEVATINVSKLWFLPFESSSNPTLLGLRIGVPDLDEANAKKAEIPAWNILDECLGEECVGLNISHVEVAPLPTTPEEEGYIELPELPTYLKWRKRKLVED